MKSSLEERFKEVDRVTTPWDEVAGGVEEVPGRHPRRGVTVASLLAAALAAAAVVGFVLVDGGEPKPAADASWLVGETAFSCVEQYSPETLSNRTYAFEGVIVAVDGPVDAPSEQAGSGTTAVTFDVDRWFWGGTRKQVSLRSYASPSSTGDVDGSVGAHLLVSGDGDFLWACGFTQPFSDDLLKAFQAAADGRIAP